MFGRNKVKIFLLFRPCRCNYYFINFYKVYRFSRISKVLSDMALKHLLRYLRPRKSDGLETDLVNRIYLYLSP